MPRGWARPVTRARQSEARGQWGRTRVAPAPPPLRARPRPRPSSSAGRRSPEARGGELRRVPAPARANLRVSDATEGWSPRAAMGASDDSELTVGALENAVHFLCPQREAGDGEKGSHRNAGGTKLLCPSTPFRGSQAWRPPSRLGCGRTLAPAACATLAARPPRCLLGAPPSAALSGGL